MRLYEKEREGLAQVKGRGQLHFKFRSIKGKQLGIKEQAQVRGQQSAGSRVLLLALSRPKREMGSFRMPTLRWVKSQVRGRVSCNRFFKAGRSTEIQQATTTSPFFGERVYNGVLAYASVSNNRP